MKMGRLELIIGCMYSGKTTELMRRVQMYQVLKKKIVAYTHSSDSRYSESGNIATHNRNIMSAIPLSKLAGSETKDEYKEAEIVFIEEGQFFPDLVEFVLSAVNRDNKIVVVSGLDGDFQLNPFENIVRLIPHSEGITKLNALCKMCGDGTPACFSKRLVDSKERELVGSDGIYEAVCRYHYYN
jgi:thymidine kinase